jgi:hypothetical protein
MWTNTEGKPRSVGQLFTAWKKCPSKQMQAGEIQQPEGANMVIVLDSLLGSLITGELSKTPIHVQVKFPA